MKTQYKFLLISMITCLSTQFIYADTDSNTSYEERYFDLGQQQSLSANEKKGTDISRYYYQGGGNIAPFHSNDGAVTFTYGSSIPTVVCAPFNVCDIALQPSEKVTYVNAGDSTRWNIEPAMSGFGPMARVHIIVKPMDVGLVTSLAIQTDRRSYHIRLKSDRKKYMPYVKFTYPEDTQMRWQQLKQQQQAYDRANLLATGEDVNNLNFNFTVSGNAKWKPIRVYSNSHQTIIEMPSNFSNYDAPILLVLRGNEQSVTNYRIIGNKYIVDNYFDKAILSVGVGFNKQKVIITRGKR